MLVVTPNLCIDRTHRLDHFAPGTVNRPRSADVAAGGKGVNVARALRDLGRSATVVGFRPEDGGAQLEQLMHAEGLQPSLVGVPGALRSAIIIVEDSGRATVLNEPGPLLTAGHRDELLHRVAELIDATRSPIVIGSGSLPPGLPVDTYAQLCRTARERGAVVIIDGAREVLAACLAAEPDLVTPNLAEAESMSTGVVVEDSDHAEDRAEIQDRAQLAARSLLAAGARRAVVTAGAHGVAYIDGDGEFWCDAPAVAMVNPIGAGDAFVGGVADHLRADFLRADHLRAELLMADLLQADHRGAGHLQADHRGAGHLQAGADWPAAVRRAVLVASAAVEHPQAGRVDAGRVLQLEAASAAGRGHVA